MVVFGTDMNSLVKTPRPTMVEFAPGDVPRFADIYNANNPANTDNPLLPVQPKSQTGTRVWDYNIDGVAHDGMLADFVKDVQTAPTSQAMAGKDIVDNHLLTVRITFIVCGKKSKHKRGTCSNWPKVRANKSWVTVCGVNSPPFGNGL